MPPWASSSLPSRRSLASVKAPFSWPNSSDSSRVRGDGRRGDPHERPARAPAVVVERARHDLLAGAGLAAQQHAHVARRDAPDRLVDLLHGRVAADERAELPDLLEPGA